MDAGHEALRVLRELKPAFHPDPVAVGGALENQFKHGPKEMPGAAGASYAIGQNVLEYLADLSGTGSTSIETGCGYSTVVLAAVFENHLCVNPDLSSNRLVREFVDRHLGSTGLRHVEKSSDYGLPELVVGGVEADLALIDGNHSHPFPVIDFHYLDQLLRPGGRLLIDNLEIEAVQELTYFLEVEPAYTLERQIDNCGVYTKVKEREFGWKSQNLRRSPEAEITRHELSLLRAAIAPELKAALSGGSSAVTSAHSSSAAAAARSLAVVAGEVPDAAEQSSPSLPKASTTVAPSGVSAVRSESLFRRLTKWYVSPSGVLLALSLALLALGFVLDGAWKWLGVAGVALMALFMPYRWGREQRRTDDRIERLMRNEVRGGLSRIRAESKRNVASVDKARLGLARDVSRRLETLTTALDFIEHSLNDVREDLAERGEDLANKVSGLAVDLSDVEQALMLLSERIERGGRAGGFRSAVSRSQPEMLHEPAVKSLLAAREDGQADATSP